MTTSKTRLLFVCMGNICRSPTAECVMRNLIETAGLSDSITCDSAGTIGYHTGNAPDPRMKAAGTSRGINITGSARKFEASDLEKFDLILAMDNDNLRDMLALAGNGQSTDHVKLLTDYSTNQEYTHVPDPYYGGEEGFQNVLDIVEESCQNLLKILRGEATKNDSSQA